ncbi:MAG: dihydropteroate synthase [Bacteroidetes bacterium]|nr:dihydropteroate synthase [Bacteroidota bacterium]
MDKTTYFYPNKTLRTGNGLLDLSTPAIMGILNVTPDSFFDGGKFLGEESALRQAEHLILQGADIVDIGGMSTRPGAVGIGAEEEMQRVLPVVTAIHTQFPDVHISIDTVYATTAKAAIEAGAGIINDISAGKMDSEIIDVAKAYKVPYILMHMQGQPDNMQVDPVYADVVKQVFDFLLQQTIELDKSGLQDIIIDPGFGFGKTLEQNYALAAKLEQFKLIGKPVLVGISRKSMICKLLKVNPDMALNGSTALHSILLLKGADILRVHDVKEAVELRKIVQALKNAV